MGTFEPGEGFLRFLIAALLLSVSCASTPTPPAIPMVADDSDVVRLKSGEVVQGKIVKMDESQVAVESAGRLRVFARKDSQNIESIAFVSPAQEMKTEAHASSAISDAIFTRIADLGTAGATLATLPSAGEGASEKVDGTILAFSLPRNDLRFWIHLIDGEKRHGKVMQAGTATHGDVVPILFQGPDLGSHTGESACLAGFFLHGNKGGPVAFVAGNFAEQSGLDGRFTLPNLLLNFLIEAQENFRARGGK